MGKIKEKKYTSNKNGDSIRLLDYEQAKKYAETTDIPLIEELALNLNCDENTVTKRAKDDPKFSTIVSYIKLKQKVAYLKMLPDRSYSTRGIIFILNVNHKMVETQRREIANPEGEIFNVSVDNFDKMSDEELRRLLITEPSGR